MNLYPNFRLSFHVFYKLRFANIIIPTNRYYSCYEVKSHSNSTKNSLIFKTSCFNPLFQPSYIIRRHLKEDGFLKRSFNKLKYNLFTKKQLENRCYICYTTLDSKIDVRKFFDVCTLEDTFYSWYVVVELHLWLLCVRVMAEGEEGKVLRNTFLKSLWLDIEERSKKLGNSNPSARRQQVKELNEHFRLSFFSYDEALNGDDKVLASALWSIMFLRECQDPELIECCVNFVRKNISHLEKIPLDIILKGKFNFLPLEEPSYLKKL